MCRTLLNEPSNLAALAILKQLEKSWLADKRRFDLKCKAESEAEAEASNNGASTNVH